MFTAESDVNAATGTTGANVPTSTQTFVRSGCRRAMVGGALDKHRRSDQDQRMAIIEARATQTFEQRMIQLEKDTDIIWWQHMRLWW